MTTKIATPHDIWPVIKQMIPDLPEHVVSFKLEFDFRKYEAVSVEITFFASLTEPFEPITKQFNLKEIP
jgi:hypothetical protein